MKVKEVWVRGDLTLSAEGGNAHNLMMMAEGYRDRGARKRLERADCRSLHAEVVPNSAVSSYASGR